MLWLTLHLDHDRKLDQVVFAGSGRVVSTRLDLMILQA